MTLEDFVMSSQGETGLLYEGNDGLKAVKDLSEIPERTRSLIEGVYDIAGKTGWEAQQPLLSFDSDYSGKYTLFLKSQNGDSQNETFISFDKDGERIFFAKYSGGISKKYQALDINNDPLIQEIQKYASERGCSLQERVYNRSPLF